MSDDFTPDPAEMERALREIVDLEKVAGTRDDGWLWRRMWELAATALDVADDPIAIGDRFVLPGLGADGGDATATIDAIVDGWATITWTNPDKTGHSALDGIRRELRLGYWQRATPEPVYATRTAILIALYDHAAPLSFDELSDLTGIDPDEIRMEANLRAMGWSAEVGWTDGIGSPIVLTTNGIEAAVALGQPARPLSADEQRFQWRADAEAAGSRSDNQPMDLDGEG